MTFLQDAALWQRLYVPWIRKATETFILYVVDQDPWEEALQAFYWGLYAAVEQGSLAPAQEVIRRWLEEGTPFWRYEQALVVTPLVNTLVRLLSRLLREHLPEEATDELGRWWGQALELLAWTAEEELEKGFRELEARQHRVEKLERLKSSFVTVVGHELRTPLTVVDGYLQMLRALVEEQDAVPASELEKVIGGMEQGMLRLRALVETVLDLAYVESGQVAQDPQPLWLHRLLEDVLEDYVPLTQERNIQLVLDPTPLPRAAVMGDPEYLAKAFAHLLDNAVKFTPDGGRITLRMRVLEEEGQVELQFQDTGIGIPPEAQQDIFGRFVRLGEPDNHSSPRTRFKGGGAGLGLAIVKGVVEAHGGHIWVESPGYDEQRCPGATFFLRLPLLPEQNLKTHTSSRME